MSRQSMLFISTVGAGAAIGVLYDVFRVLRKTAPHKNPFVQLEDLLFWLITTLLMFYFMLNTHYGEIRFYSIMGTALGMITYFATLSPWVVKIAVALVEFIKQVVATAVKIILLPINILLRLLIPPVKKLIRISRKYLHAARVYGKIKIKKTARNWFIIRKKV